jgi:MaoC like domain
MHLCQPSGGRICLQDSGHPVRGPPSLADGIWKTSRLGRPTGPVDCGSSESRALPPSSIRSPFHLNADAARTSILGGLAASGWHTAALTMRLLVESDLKPAGGIVGVGFDELRWPRPVRPGDELRLESEVLDVRPSKSRPQQGLIKVRMTTLNQNARRCRFSSRT